jgi:hypothetical protein
MGTAGQKFSLKSSLFSKICFFYNTETSCKMNTRYGTTNDLVSCGADVLRQHAFRHNGTVGLALTSF